MSNRMCRLPSSYLLMFCCFTFAYERVFSRTTPHTSMIFNTSSNPEHYVVRNVTVSTKTDVNLTCSNKTWSEIMFVTWKIQLKDKDCIIAFNNEGGSKDTCNDGKSLRNTAEAQSYLHIPNFSNDDIGAYKCEAVYVGGIERYKINVAIRVAPSISSWLQHKGNKMVAVCKAERGKPAANISWSHTGNLSPVETLIDSHGFFTVESRLEILEGIKKNLTCIIRHPYWEGEQTLEPESLKGNGTLLRFLVVGVIIAILVGALCFANKNNKQGCKFSHNEE